MQDGIALERKTKDELKQIAQGLEIEKISSLKKEDLIFAIREKRKDAQKQFSINYGINNSKIWQRVTR
jgi:transcription termination factor Rho